MRKIIILLFGTLLFSSCTAQQNITFQDKLSDYITNREYLSNGLPFIEFINNNQKNLIFWHKLYDKNYLIFVENKNIYFVMDCGFLPVGENNIGEIKVWYDYKIDTIKGLNFAYVNQNMVSNYPENNNNSINNVSKQIDYLPYKVELSFESFHPIEIELEIPVLFLKVEDSLLMAPLEQ